MVTFYAPIVFKKKFRLHHGAKFNSTVKSPNFAVGEVILPSAKNISAPMVKVSVHLEKNGKKEISFK